MADAIQVDRFRLLPLADLGAADNAASFHPKALAGVGMDTNPGLRADAGGAEPIMRLGVGLDMQAQFVDGWSAGLSGFYLDERYRNTAVDAVWYGEVAGRATRNGASSQFGAKVVARHTRDPAFDAPLVAQRDEISAELGGTLFGTRDATSSRLQYDHREYAEDTAQFSRTERNTDRLSAMVAFNRMGADETRVGGQLDTAVLTYSGDSPNNDAVLLTGVANWRHGLGSRTWFEINAGAEGRFHTDYSAGDPANDDQNAVAPAGRIRVRWDFLDRSHIEVLASTGLAEGVGSNSNDSRQDAAAIQGRVAPAERVEVSLAGWVQRHEDLASGPQGGERTEDRNLDLIIDLRLFEGIGLRLSGSAQHHGAVKGGTYDRQVVAVEMFAAL